VPGSLPPFDVRLTSAVAVGKLARLASRRFGFGGGTALPGVLAGRLDRGALGKLTRGLARGTVLVTGTNGKTTTCRLLAAMMREGGWRPIHNRAGANLTSGLTTALIEQSDLIGRSEADSALFEVDEAIAPAVQAAVKPRAVVLTNLFRDQLDRYGEVDHVVSVWREGIRSLGPDTRVILNADDPALAALGRSVRGPVSYFGVDTPGEPGSLDNFADTKNCPFCGSPLSFELVRYAHLGTYRCPQCDFVRPDPTIAATTIVQQGVEATELTVTGPFGCRHWRFQLPGLYNVYNLLAAVATATAVGIPIEAIERALSDVTAAFGRLERIAVDGRTLFIVLVKNPVGLTQALSTILSEPTEKDLAILINDNLADGTDVSWLWDAEVELLAGRCRSVIVSGTRGADMAVRLKYAGVPVDRICHVESVEEALDVGIASVPVGGTLYVLPTYTAMLELRTLVGRRGYASRYWET
jgi:lipid II isoglutaminyl synthase (glutamine-hydrolysing)